MIDNIADTVKLLESGQPDSAAWMERLTARIKEAAMKKSCDMGMLEQLIESELKALGRPILAQAVQELANRQALRCPSCEGDLQVQEHERERWVDSVFGKVQLRRSYGYCPRCRERVYPADQALGLHEQAHASPRVQEICALMVLESPAGQAAANVRRLTGLDMSPASMHREARRQGERALQIREATVRLGDTIEGLRALTQQARTPQGPYTLVIQIDAWNIRERDHWGETEKLLRRGEELSRWHWVYTATIFRLDQRGKSASGRPLISERGYVATRQGIAAFTQQLYVEALQRGLANAEMVLVLADGAAWIWNLVEERFKQAVQRVDFWHVAHYLRTVANDLYGQGTPEAAQWVQPLLRWLKNRKDGALDVLHSLQELRSTLEGLTQKQQETFDKTVGYFDEHKDRMDYKNAKNLHQPLGSGAVESTCAQYQCRFKRTGQFWSLDGDEAFLALSTLHRNQRWHLLFPHDRQNHSHET